MPAAGGRYDPHPCQRSRGEAGGPSKAGRARQPCHGRDRAVLSDDGLFLIQDAEGSTFLLDGDSVLKLAEFEYRMTAEEYQGGSLTAVALIGGEDH